MNTMSENDFDVHIEEFNIDFDYEISPEDLMEKIDKASKDMCEDDYDLIIAEGFASWFWLRARYEIPVICINPALYPDEVYENRISDETRKSFWYIQDTRNQRTTYIACLINDDELYDPSEDFDNERIFETDIEINNEEFWNKDSELFKAIDYVLDES